jgi:TRAP-type mannitol/chloroaromatic compound transport system permease large subunit
VPTDEKIVVAMCGGSFFAWLIAVANRVTHLGLLSKLAERVTFVLIPPLLLIFLVLGTIFLGMATPTEGGAMGAMGALIMAVMRKRLNWALLRRRWTRRPSCLLRDVHPDRRHRVQPGVPGRRRPGVGRAPADQLPGGQLGFLIVVNILVFFLAFFLDFFELSFIVVPLLAPWPTRWAST